MSDAADSKNASPHRLSLLLSLWCLVLSVWTTRQISNWKNALLFPYSSSSSGGDEDKNDHLEGIVISHERCAMERNVGSFFTATKQRRKNGCRAVHVRTRLWRHGMSRCRVRGQKLFAARRVSIRVLLMRRRVERNGVRYSYL